MEKEQNNQQQNQEIKYGALTEQGNFGLGFNEVDNEKNKEFIKKELKNNK